MEEEKIIGGEFELNADLLCSINNRDITSNYITYSSGRAALFNILEANGEKRKSLLIPDYICESIIRTAQIANYNIGVYHLDNQLLPEYKSIENSYTGKEIVLIINYFGLIDSESIVKNLRKIDQKMLIILDNVQAPFAMKNLTNADYTFTSFRKSFPVPDGGWVVVKSGNLPRFDNISSFSQYKIAGSVLKGIGFHNSIFDEIYLELLNKGEAKIDDDFHSDMSLLSKKIIENINWERISLIRRRNARIIINGLMDLGITPLLKFNEKYTPLFIPVILHNRNNVRKALFEKKIFCPVHWPVSTSGVKLLKGEELAQTELSLIVDQRYGCEDMKKMLQVIEDCK